MFLSFRSPSTLFLGCEKVGNIGMVGQEEAFFSEESKEFPRGFIHLCAKVLEAIDSFSVERQMASHY